MPRRSAALTAARVLAPLALAASVAFIFSNSMEAAQVSTVSSGQVQAWLQAALARLGLGSLAPLLTMHFVRKLAHFLEYMLEGFLLLLCMRLYTRRTLRHISWPLLAGLLTALADETIQLYSPGRSSQVRDVWLDMIGVTAGAGAALVLLALLGAAVRRYQHRNEDKTP